MSRSMVAQDRRRHSRIRVRIPCKIVADGVEQDTHILDMSLTSAYLWLPAMPAEGSSVSLKLQHRYLKNPLILYAKVTRGCKKFVGIPPPGPFAVQFSNGSAEIAQLLARLSGEGRRNSGRAGVA